MADSRSSQPPLKLGPLWQLFVSIGAALVLAAAAAPVLHQRNLATETGRTTGTVVDFVEHYHTRVTIYKPVIQFTTAAGEVERFQSGVANLPGQPDHVGQQVPVAYDPTNPTRATIDSFAETWYLTLFLGGTGLLLIAGGLLARKNAALSQAAQDPVA